MAFLTIKEDSVKTEGQGNYISTSGIYSVNLKAAEVASTKNGATQVNYYMDKCMSFGNTVADKSGKPIFGMKIIEALGDVLSESVLSDPESTEVSFKKGTKELMCIPELTDVDVKVWLQFEYRLWQGNIQEDVNVKRFYRDSDNASGSEALAGESIGSQFAKDEKYATEVKYSDGLDEAAVAAWKKEQAGGDKKAATATPAAKGAGTAFPGTAN